MSHHCLSKSGIFSLSKAFAPLLKESLCFMTLLSDLVLQNLIMLPDYRDIDMHKSCLTSNKFLGSAGFLLWGFFGFFYYYFQREVILLVNGAELICISSRDKDGLLRCLFLELLFTEKLVFKAFKDFAIAAYRWFWKAKE